ncbi:MAG: hypothetical protein ABSH08_21155 [Tepidisphaeraceae bacterium]
MQNAAVPPRYEELLTNNPRWALNEGSEFFEGKGAVQETLRRVTKRLDELGIPYVVVEGLALFHHGFRRFTEDVDLLVTPQGLTAVHKELDGLGYVRPFAGSKNLRDASTGVRIEFLVTGQFPGDGKPKPVSFPDPTTVSVESDGIKYLNLPALIDLKLASGMTNPDREKDVVDVKELIKALNLRREMSDQLSPYVQDKYGEIWDAIRSIRRRYVKLWRNKSLTLDSKTIDEMIQTLRKAADTLAAMLADGVTLDPAGGTSDDYALLVTENSDVAAKYDMHEESEFWEEPNNDDADKAETK